MRLATTFLILTFLIIGCKKDESSPIENGPAINIISPTSQDMPTTGSIVEINAAITDDDEVHDVTINITSDYSTDPASIEIIFDHIHNSVFNVDTSFIADIPSGSMANYTIQISAEDMSGNSNSESVTFYYNKIMSALIFHKNPIGVDPIPKSICSVSKTTLRSNFLLQDVNDDRQFIPEFHNSIQCSINYCRFFLMDC